MSSLHYQVSPNPEQHPDQPQQQHHVAPTPTPTTSAVAVALGQGLEQMNQTSNHDAPSPAIHSTTVLASPVVVLNPFDHHSLTPAPTPTTSHNHNPFIQLHSEQEQQNEQLQQQQQYPSTTSSDTQWNSAPHSNIIPPPPPDDDDLPVGWNIATRATDGRIYYYHLETGQTTWEHPVGALRPSLPVEEDTNTTIVDGIITGADHIMKDFGMNEYRKYLPKVSPTTAERGTAGSPAQRNVQGQDGDAGRATATTAASQAAQMQDEEANNNINNSKEASLLDSFSATVMKKPSNNKCLLCLALLCCLPLGCCAWMHHRNAARDYNNGNYGNARSASAKATNYTGLACLLGSAAIVYYLYLNDWNLPPFLEHLLD